MTGRKPRVTALGELHHFATHVLAERLEGLGDDAFGVEAGLGIHGVGRVLIDENVRQHHRADLEPAVEHAVLGERLQHIGAEAADRAFLDGEQHFVLAGEPQQHVDVERLGKARIGDRGREAIGRQARRRP